MSVKCIPLKPHFYIEKRVYRGIHNFVIFDAKHTLWVLVRTEARRFQRVPTNYVLSENIFLKKSNFSFLANF